MLRKLAVEKETAFFERHSGIVFGALKKEGVLRSYPDYDDYVQQGLLKLVEAYETFPQDPEDPEHIYPFGGFAFRKIQWHIRDIRKKQKRINVNESAWPEFMEENYPDTPTQFEADWLEMELFKDMLPLLTVKEQGYLIDAVIHQLSVTEIAQKNQVSRKTIYQWKKSIHKKLEHFLVFLKE